MSEIEMSLKLSIVLKNNRMVDRILYDWQVWIEGFKFFIKGVIILL